MKSEIIYIKSIEKTSEVLSINVTLNFGYYCLPITKSNICTKDEITKDYFEDHSSLIFKVYNKENEFIGKINIKLGYQNQFDIDKVYIKTNILVDNQLRLEILKNFCSWFQKCFFTELFYYKEKEIILNQDSKKKMILTAGPSIGLRELIYSSDATSNGWNNEWNKYLKKFENSFAEYVGVKYAIATSSCTGAMQLALMALDIGEGDEVIVPDITWVSTANVVHAIGATPIFADVNIDSWTIDPKSIESKITNKTKAIMPVHMYGHPAEMKPILEISKKYNLKIIEDAAPSIGAYYLDKKTGSFGDFSAFSFQGAKLLVTGEGGMLCTNNENLYKKAYRLWDQGRIPGTFWIEEHGPKYKMSNIQAAIGLGQLERNDLMVYKKRKINNWYRKRLANNEKIIFWEESNKVKSICWMTSIRLKNNLKLSREEFCKKLKERNIDTRPVFPSISQYPYWNKKQVSQKNSSLIAETGINLPSGVCLTKSQVDYVCDNIIEILKSEK